MLDKLSAWISTVAAIIMIGAAFHNGNWPAAWFASAAAFFSWRIAARA